jgi:putative endonuclease
MFTVYIIKNSSGKSYIGQTVGLDSRLAMHNDTDINKRKFHNTTFGKGPWELDYKKDFLTRSEALRFEHFLKTGSGREWLEHAHLGG